jgi:hypothetical protein
MIVDSILEWVRSDLFEFRTYIFLENDSSNNKLQITELEIIKDTPLYVIKKVKMGYNEKDEVVVNQTYTKSGDYIGDEKTAKILCDKYGISPEKSSSDHCVCSIGYSEKNKKWYGWSHRAICGFGIGDKFSKVEDDDNNKTKLIKNMEEAKQSAINFADSVS